MASEPTARGLTLPEELFLLWIQCGRMHRRGLGAAVLSELLLTQRIGVQRSGLLKLMRKYVVVVDSSPTGDDILDSTIEWLLARKRTPELGGAIQELAVRTHTPYFQRLEERGLIEEREVPRALRRGTTTKPAVIAEDVVQEIRTRVRAALVEQAPAAARTLALVSLVHKCRTTRCVVELGERGIARRNAKRLPGRYKEIAAAVLDPELANDMHDLVRDLGDVAAMVTDVGGGGNGADYGSPQ